MRVGAGCPPEGAEAATVPSPTADAAERFRVTDEPAASGGAARALARTRPAAIGEPA